jgi:hypothetical protein
MGGVCSADGEGKVYIRFWWGNLKKRGDLKEQEQTRK